MYKSEWVIQGLRELATKEKLGEKSDGGLTVTQINKLQKYYRRAIVNNTYDFKSMQDDIQASLYHCSSANQRPVADVQRVLYHGAFLIKENGTDQREVLAYTKISEKLYCAEKTKQAKRTEYRTDEH